MKKIIYFTLIILVLAGLVWTFFVYFKKIKPSQSITAATDPITVELQIHDSGSKSLVVQNDGTMIFKDGDKVSQIKVSAQEVESLKQEIRKRNVLGDNFFTLKEKYEGTGCCDFVAHTVTVTVGDKIYSVYCYNECPENLTNLIEKIESLWPNKIQYNGFS